MDTKFAARMNSKPRKAVLKFEKTTSRFIKLLEKRYRGQYTYLSSTSQDLDWDLVKSLLYQKQVITLDEANYFPVFSEEQVVGVLKRRGHSLQFKELQEILSLADLVLSSAYDLLTRDCSLARRESFLTTESFAPEIVSMAQFRKDRQPKANPFFSMGELPSKSVPTLVEASQIEEAFKFSFDLHSSSGRYAFVNYWDLDLQTKTNLSQLNELGPFSLYLPKPHELSQPEQISLKSFLVQSTSADSFDSILWLTATEIPFSELTRMKDLDQQLLRMLAISYFKVRESVKNMLGSEVFRELH